MQRKGIELVTVTGDRQTGFSRHAGLSGAALIALAALTWSAGVSALAQDPQALGKYGDWRAYSFDENGDKACYIASQPKKDEGKYKKRGDIYAMVTHRPAESVRDEVSLSAGYTYKEASQVEVTIGSNKFELYPHQDTAWLPDAVGDEQLVAAMKAGRTMVVRGTSSRGTTTKDTYSLAGFTKAYKAASKACGL